MTGKRQQGLYIVLSAAVLSLAVTLVDAFLQPDYVPKVLVKIFFFLMIPLFYFGWNKKERPLLKKLFRLNGKTMVQAGILGILIYGVIVGGYLCTKGFVDFSHVTATLQEKHGITGENFIFVSLYISLANSFLEEFFFRGFAFLSLKPYIGRKLAYIFSPALFAFYHGGMLAGMFSWWVFLVLLTGLFVGGCIFNYLNEKSESIYTSWITHMFANFAINTVGFMLFRIG